ncbi:MAG: substrate-binding domain-containing protein, partial [Gaiellales bacterium]
MLKGKRWASALICLVALATIASSCGDEDPPTGDGGDDLSGSLNISGSSTVEPITSLVSEKFRTANPGVDIAVDSPGTSDGFELFCNGETDLQDASRPIDEEEVAACGENGIEPIELE